MVGVGDTDEVCVGDTDAVGVVEGMGAVDVVEGMGAVDVVEGMGAVGVEGMDEVGVEGTDVGATAQLCAVFENHHNGTTGVNFRPSLVFRLRSHPISPRNP